jgi:hypothetical protein
MNRQPSSLCPKNLFPFASGSHGDRESPLRDPRGLGRLAVCGETAETAILASDPCIVSWFGSSPPRPQGIVTWSWPAASWRSFGNRPLRPSLRVDRLSDRSTHYCVRRRTTLKPSRGTNPSHPRLADADLGATRSSPPARIRHVIHPLKPLQFPIDQADELRRKQNRLWAEPERG